MVPRVIRTTVNLTAHANDARWRVASRLGCDGNDALNRAIVLYNTLLRIQESPGTELRAVRNDGSSDRIIIT